MTNKQLETRLKVFAYVLVGIFIILARLWYMQIIRGEHYSTLAEGNRIRRIPVTAPRGIFTTGTASRWFPAGFPLQFPFCPQP